MGLPSPRTLVLALAVTAAVVGVVLLIAQDQETLQVRTTAAVGDPDFSRHLARLLGRPLSEGAEVVAYADGRQAFAVMLDAIAGAERRISFEQYIYGPGAVADRFTAALESACRRGVEVRMVLDAVGAKGLPRDHLARLEEAGCRIGWFNPVSVASIEEANYRTHRKALVVDGLTAFVGGIGVDDQWAEDTSTAPRWRDTHFEFRGPVALDVEAAVHENWIESGGVVVVDLRSQATTQPGTARTITVWSSPEGGTNGLKLLYLLSLAAARSTLDIQSPYLITDASTEWSLLDARRRGVRIRLLVEGDITDARPVKLAGRAGYGRLLEAGIEIYEYQPSMMHAKALIADGALSIVGSANFNNRSFELNDELNVAVFDAALAARLRDDFERDLTQSRRLDPVQWKARPLRVRAIERAWSLFGEVF
jgi:cardiolipin synthase